jgi:autotransporter-associated beta strand protein
LLSRRWFLVGSLACLIASQDFVAAQTWSGLGTTGNWTDAGNWIGGVPSNDGSASLTFGDGENPAPNVNTPWSINSILFTSDAGPYSMTGSGLTMGGGGLTNLDSDTQGFGNAIDLAATQSWNATAGGFSFGGVVTQGTHQLTLDGPFGFTFNAAVNGSGNLVIRDAAPVSVHAASTATGNWTISESNTGGSLSFSAANQVGSGTLTINQSGRLTLRDSGGSGTVTLANTMRWNGERYVNGLVGGNATVSPIIEVAGASDTLVLTSLITMIDRQGILKTGPGSLRYAPTTLASDSRWSLGIAQGAVEMNQLPYRSGQNNNQGQPTGDLEFVGNSTLRVLYDSSIAMSLPSLIGNVGRYGYGFGNVRVASGVTGTIEVQSGAVFKTSGRTDTNNAFLRENATLVLAGADLTSQFQFGVGNSGGTINESFVNRTIDLRGGSLSFFGVDKTFWPQTVDFTMKLNGGEYDGRNQASRQSLPGNLVINDNPSSSTPQVRAWIISDTGGGNSSYGNIIWNGDLIKVGDAGDTLSFNRNTAGSGTGGYVAVAANARLDVQGGIVSVAGGLDPFTDSFDATRHVAVNLASGTQLRANRSIGIGGLSGNGTVTTNTSGTKTILIEGSGNATFSGNVTSGSGFLNLAKAGAGTQTFTANLTYNGTTTINGGRITLSGDGRLTATSGISVNRGELFLDNSVTNNNDRLGDSIPIYLGLGTTEGSLVLLGNSGVSTTETVGVVTANAGPGSIVVTPGSGQTATLTLSGLAQTVGGTLDFKAGSGTLGGGGATDPKVLVTGQAAGLIGGWGTVGNSFAEYDPTNGVRAFVSSHFNYNSNNATVRNIDVDQTQTLTDNDAELSVRYIAAVDTDFGGFHVNIHNGGLLKADATTTTISNGTLTAADKSPGDLTLTVAQGGTLDIAATIANNSGNGTVTLVKSGAGQANLQSSNTFSGGLYLTEGTLGFADDSHLGHSANDVSFYGGTLRKNGTVSDVTLSSGRQLLVTGGLSGTVSVIDQSLILGTTGQLVVPSTSSLVKTGAGTLGIHAANTSFTGGLSVTSGTVELRDAQALGTAAVTLSGGVLRTRLNGDATFGNSLVVTADSSLETSRFDGSSTQQTHTFGSLAINDSQLSVLASTGDYASRFTALALSGISQITTASGASLEVAGPVTGTGFTKNGSGTLVFGGTAPNTLSGSVAVTAGTLRLTKSGGAVAINRDLTIGGSAAATVVLAAGEQIANSAAVTMTGTSTLDLGGTTETIGSLAAAVSTAQVNLGAGTLRTGASNTSTTFAGTIQGTGSLVKQGTGTMTLGGVNTYSGGTEIQGGTLRLGGNDRLSSSTVVNVSSGGVFDLDGNDQAVTGLAGNGTILTGGGRLTTGGATNHTFAGSIAGSGDYTHQGPGTQVLSGQNVYTGLTTVTGGRLELGRDGALNSLSELLLDDATFATGGYSQTLASLELTADADFDFGDLSSVLVFDTVAPSLSFLNGNILTIADWTGEFETAGGIDQLIVMEGLFDHVNSTTSLIQFVIDSVHYEALFLARPDLGAAAVEVVPSTFAPVPEPTTITLLAAAALVFIFRRKPA